MTNLAEGYEMQAGKFQEKINRKIKSLQKSKQSWKAHKID